MGWTGLEYNIVVLVFSKHIRWLRFFCGFFVAGIVFDLVLFLGGLFFAFPLDFLVGSSLIAGFLVADLFQAVELFTVKLVEFRIDI